MEPIRVQVPAHWCRRAAEWAAKIAPRLPSSPNPTGLVRDERFYIGYLGELALGRLLVDWKVSFYHHRAQSGRSEREEFELWPDEKREQRSTLVEVKTASQAGYRYMMMPEYQFEKALQRPQLIFVAARIECRTQVGEDDEEAFVDVMGMATQEVMAQRSRLNTEREVPTREILFADMDPVGSLLKRFSGRGFAPPDPKPKIDTSSEEYRHACEVRMLESLEVGQRVRWLADLRKKRGDAAVDQIMKSMSRWCLQEIADETAVMQRERELAGILR